MKVDIFVYTIFLKAKNSNWFLQVLINVCDWLSKKLRWYQIFENARYYKNVCTIHVNFSIGFLKWHIQNSMLWFPKVVYTEQHAQIFQFQQTKFSLLVLLRRLRLIRCDHSTKWFSRMTTKFQGISTRGQQSLLSFHMSLSD